MNPFNLKLCPIRRPSVNNPLHTNIMTMTMMEFETENPKKQQDTTFLI